MLGRPAGIKQASNQCLPRSQDQIKFCSQACPTFEVADHQVAPEQVDATFQHKSVDVQVRKGGRHVCQPLRHSYIKSCMP
jgi:hypothetical protein